jgi:hypothetical protein
MKLSTIVLLALSLLATLDVFSQTRSGAVSGRIMVGSGTFEGITNFDTPGLLREKVLTGQPYSADRVSEHTQTLADGTHIKQVREMSREYRDSEGRIRTERKLFSGPRVPAAARRDSPLLVQIFDPVAGYSYTLDSRKLIAHRVALPAENGPGVFTARPNVTMVPGSAGRLGVRGPLRQRIKKESLGNETIEGVLAVGTRVINTTPTGEVGNDRPLVRTCEHWQSEEMALTLLTKCSDPRTGETAMRLEHVDRIEPDPVLFQVPPEYTVVEDEGRFSIGYGPVSTRKESTR